MIGNGRTRFVPFHQSANKEVRIFTRSAEVQNLTFFPTGWEKMYPDFHKHLTNYMKVGNNRFDDAPDALTGSIEQRGRHAAQGVTVRN
jgi:predicted phage terminase large subunit-like protein